MVDNRDVAAHRADDDQRHRQLVLMQDWLDGFERIAADRAGGTYIACPPKGLLHRTEGSSIDGAIGAFRTTGSWPTITADSDARRKVQHYPLSISARALAHPQGRSKRTGRTSCRSNGSASPPTHPTKPPTISHGSVPKSSDPPAAPAASRSRATCSS
jgi:hypothetical protein